jgi:hypothetical protein
MASTAGCHFFKCPLCNNTKEFREEMMQFGIYLPDQVKIIIYLYFLIILSIY